MKVELTAPILDKISLGKLDNLLRTKKYRVVVDEMLKQKKFFIDHPDIAVAAFQQLRLRNKLNETLINRKEDEIAKVCTFLRHNLLNNLYFEILSDVVMVLLGRTPLFIRKPRF